MNASILRNIGLVFAANLAWVACVMYAATKLALWNTYLDLALYWIAPLSVYLLLLHRSGWVPKVHRALRLAVFGVIGFGLSLVAVASVAMLYSLIL